MDESERLEARMEKYERYAYEYEKRFINSLALTSGAAFGFCLTFSKKFDNPELFLKRMLLSMWCFLAALILSGALSVIMSRRYDRLGLSVTLYRFARLRKNAEKTKNFDGVNEYISTEAYSEMGAKDYKIAKRLHIIHWVFISLASALIVLGLSWPLYLLSKDGLI